MDDTKNNDRNNDRNNEQASGITRREFVGLSLAVGLSAGLASGGDLKIVETDVEIKTPDGAADAYMAHPAKGKYPGVLIWPDIFGLRPAFKNMATRLAESGYSVLVFNPFYRTKRAPTAPVPRHSVQVSSLAMVSFLTVPCTASQNEISI